MKTGKKNKDLAGLLELEDEVLRSAHGTAISVSTGPIAKTSDLEDTPNNDTFADSPTTISTGDAGEDNDEGAVAF